MTVSDTSVASSVRTDTSRGCELALWFEGRQDRFHGGSVKSARFADPRCLPLLDTPRNPSHFKIRNANEPAVLLLWPGAHVMRIA